MFYRETHRPLHTQTQFHKCTHTVRQTDRQDTHTHTHTHTQNNGRTGGDEVARAAVAELVEDAVAVRLCVCVGGGGMNGWVGGGWVDSFGRFVFSGGATLTCCILAWM